ncbi:MAG: hypothetical protein ACOCUS_06455, partial [Polyangiales bacterium]
LGAPTIMDRALAARHGVPYVHLAVFAIDVDRVRELHEDLGAWGGHREPMAGDPARGRAGEKAALGEEPDWPLGGEVFLTEAYLLRYVDPTDEDQLQLVEDVCLGILELKQADVRLGVQVPFAVYDAVARGAWPKELERMFRPWKRRAEPLVKELSAMWERPEEQTARLAELCLDAPVEPPLADPTIEALLDMEESGPTPEQDGAPST